MRTINISKKKLIVRVLLNDKEQLGQFLMTKNNHNRCMSQSHMDVEIKNEGHLAKMKTIVES